MTTNPIFKTMIDRYNELSYTHNYIFGLAFNGNIYATFTDESVLPYVCCLDKASSKNGGGYSLRYKPNKTQKATLFANSEKTFIVCSVEYFNEMVETTKYNKGEIFEKLITEYFGMNWEKDNVPFTEGGDIEINGKAFQIKYEKATFTNEKFLQARA